jgi:hypothetical protein
MHKAKRRRPMRFTRTVGGGVLVGVLAAVPAFAQTVAGSLQATITDASGQPVPMAIGSGER